MKNWSISKDFRSSLLLSISFAFSFYMSRYAFLMEYVWIPNIIIYIMWMNEGELHSIKIKSGYKTKCENQKHKPNEQSITKNIVWLKRVDANIIWQLIDRPNKCFDIKFVHFFLFVYNTFSVFCWQREFKWLWSIFRQMLEET